MGKKKVIDEENYDPSPVGTTVVVEEPLLEAPIDLAGHEEVAPRLPMHVCSYRKRPVVIQAVQFEGGPGGALRVFDVFDIPGATFSPGVDLNTGELNIPTLEGEMRASAGDWIIRGVRGEYYPCKPDIFEATYELVDPPADAIVEAPSIFPKSIAQMAYERMVDQFDDAEVKFDSWEEMNPLVRKVFEERAESLEHDALFEECVRQVVENDLRDPAPSHPFPASSDAVIAPATATNA